METSIGRLLKKYDALILELENIETENKSFVKQANENPDAPEIRQWARLARENQRRLIIVKAERDYLAETYEDKEI